MQFIRTIPPEAATGDLKALYERTHAAGQPSAVLQAWSLRPDVLEAWRALEQTIRSHTDERRYQLVSLVVASAVRCSVCALRYGTALTSKYFTATEVQSLACDFHDAGLDAVDEAVASFAVRAALHADEITQEEVDALRALGLDDDEIFDVALAATYRVGWSRSNDAIGYEASQPFLKQARSQLGEEVFESLIVGRAQTLRSES